MFKKLWNTFGVYAATEKKIEANWGHFIRWALVLAVFAAIIEGLFPNLTPYSFWGLWKTKGNVGQWLISSWPILLWAGGLTLLVSILTRNTKKQNENAEVFWLKGLWLSLRAGVMEEIIFRWLMFMLMMTMVQVADYILGGFIFSHGLVWVVNEYIALPVANFFTAGLLRDTLMDPKSWIIASALLAANARFRDGHKYQGLIGLINSWVIGMYMFWLLLTYGLVAAIVVHFVYDALIFSIQSVDRLIERKRGVSRPEEPGETDEV